MSTVIDLRGRHLMKLADYSPDEIRYLIDLAAELKAAKREGREEQKLVGKEIALIFEKDSTRTRCAFEVAAYDQGAHVTFIGPCGSHMGHKETVKDTARVLGRMYDAIEYRGFGAGHRRGARALGRRPDLQRAHRRVAPDPDPRRLPDVPRAPLEAAQRGRLLLPRRRALQHGRLVPDRRGEARDGRAHREPAVALAARRDRRARALDRRRDRRRITITDDVAEAVQRRRRAAHRRLGLDGRAGRGLEGAHRAAHAVPDQRGGRWRPPATRTPSSCTACRRSTTPRPRSARRSSRSSGWARSR